MFGSSIAMGYLAVQDVTANRAGNRSGSDTDGGLECRNLGNAQTQTIGRDCTVIARAAPGTSRCERAALICGLGMRTRDARPRRSS